MKILNYDELSAQYKRSGKISPRANRIANRLICEFVIQLNGNLALFLDVDISLDNHKAVRVWIQKHLDNQEHCSSDNYEYFKNEMYKCIPIYN